MKQSIRINFDDQEGANVQYLLGKYSLKTPQSLIRQLIANSAKENREFDLRYGPKGSSGSGSGSRETAAERRNRLEAMSDEDLTAELNALGALDSYKNTFEDTVYITKDDIGRRIMRVAGPNGGGDTPLSMFLNILAKQKII